MSDTCTENEVVASGPQPDRKAAMLGPVLKLNGIFIGCWVFLYFLPRVLALGGMMAGAQAWNGHLPEWKKQLTQLLFSAAGVIQYQLTGLPFRGFRALNAMLLALAVTVMCLPQPPKRWLRLVRGLKLFMLLYLLLLLARLIVLHLK